jgi:hypothetical protein
MRAMPFEGFRGIMKQTGRLYRRNFIPILLMAGALILGGCLPPKKIIAPLEPPVIQKPQEAAPEKPSLSEEQLKLQQLIKRLEEAEKRLLEAQRKTEEAFKKAEEASLKTAESASRLEKAQEKLDAIGQKETP